MQMLIFYYIAIIYWNLAISVRSQNVSTNAAKGMEDEDILKALEYLASNGNMKGDPFQSAPPLETSSYPNVDKNEDNAHNNNFEFKTPEDNPQEPQKPEATHQESASHVNNENKGANRPEKIGNEESNEGNIADQNLTDGRFIQPKPLGIFPNKSDFEYDEMDNDFDNDKAQKLKNGKQEKIENNIKTKNYVYENINTLTTIPNQVIDESYHQRDIETQNRRRKRAADFPEGGIPQNPIDFGEPPNGSFTQNGPNDDDYPEGEDFDDVQGDEGYDPENGGYPEVDEKFGEDDDDELPYTNENDLGHFYPEDEFDSIENFENNQLENEIQQPKSLGSKNNPNNAEKDKFKPEYGTNSNKIATNAEDGKTENNENSKGISKKKDGVNDKNDKSTEGNEAQNNDHKSENDIDETKKEDEIDKESTNGTDLNVGKNDPENDEITAATDGKNNDYDMSKEVENPEEGKGLAKDGASNENIKANSLENTTEQDKDSADDDNIEEKQQISVDTNMIKDEKNSANNQKITKESKNKLSNENKTNEDSNKIDSNEVSKVGQNQSKAQGSVKNESNKMENEDNNIKEVDDRDSELNPKSNENNTVAKGDSAEEDENDSIDNLKNSETDHIPKIMNDQTDSEYKHSTKNNEKTDVSSIEDDGDNWSELKEDGKDFLKNDNVPGDKDSDISENDFQESKKKNENEKELDSQIGGTSNGENENIGEKQKISKQINSEKNLNDTNVEDSASAEKVENSKENDDDVQDFEKQTKTEEKIPGEKEKNDNDIGEKSLEQDKERESELEKSREANSNSDEDVGSHPYTRKENDEEDEMVEDDEGQPKTNANNSKKGLVSIEDDDDVDDDDNIIDDSAKAKRGNGTKPVLDQANNEKSIDKDLDTNYDVDLDDEDEGSKHPQNDNKQNKVKENTAKVKQTEDADKNNNVDKMKIVDSEEETAKASDEEDESKELENNREAGVDYDEQSSHEHKPNESHKTENVQGNGEANNKGNKTKNSFNDESNKQNKFDDGESLESLGEDDELYPEAEEDDDFPMNNNATVSNNSNKLENNKDVVKIGLESDENYPENEDNSQDPSGERDDDLAENLTVHPEDEIDDVDDPKVGSTKSNNDNNSNNKSIGDGKKIAETNNQRIEKAGKPTDTQAVPASKQPNETNTTTQTQLNDNNEDEDENEGEKVMDDAGVQHINEANTDDKSVGAIPRKTAKNKTKSSTGTKTKMVNESKENDENYISNKEENKKKMNDDKDKPIDRNQTTSEQLNKTDTATSPTQPADDNLDDDDIDEEIKTNSNGNDKLGENQKNEFNEDEINPGTASVSQDMPNDQKKNLSSTKLKTNSESEEIDENDLSNEKAGIKTINLKNDNSKDKIENNTESKETLEDNEDKSEIASNEKDDENKNEDKPPSSSDRPNADQTEKSGNIVDLPSPGEEPEIPYDSNEEELLEEKNIKNEKNPGENDDEFSKEKSVDKASDNHLSSTTASDDENDKQAPNSEQPARAKADGTSNKNNKKKKVNKKKKSSSLKPNKSGIESTVTPTLPQNNNVKPSTKKDSTNTSLQIDKLPNDDNDVISQQPGSSENSDNLNTSPQTGKIGTITPGVLAIPDCKNQAGQWSEWRQIGMCSDDCGACGVVQKVRDCLSYKGGAGCPCIGEYKITEVCNVGVCDYPRPSCCMPYKLEYWDGHFVCGPQSEEIKKTFLENRGTDNGVSPLKLRDRVTPTHFF